MITELKQYTVEQISDGFVYNELEGKGLFGLSGRLTIQPEYQRNYIYADAATHRINTRIANAFHLHDHDHSHTLCGRIVSIIYI